MPITSEPIAQLRAYWWFLIVSCQFSNCLISLHHNMSWDPNVFHSTLWQELIKQRLTLPDQPWSCFANMPSMAVMTLMTAWVSEHIATSVLITFESEFFLYLQGNNFENYVIVSNVCVVLTQKNSSVDMGLCSSTHVCFRPIYEPDLFVPYYAHLTLQPVILRWDNGL